MLGVNALSICLHYILTLGAENDKFKDMSETEVLSSFKLPVEELFLISILRLSVRLRLVSLSVHPSKKNRQTCVRKSLICAFAMAFIISVMLIAANQMLRNGME